MVQPETKDTAELNQSNELFISKPVPKKVLKSCSV